jgi:glutamyl-tRNA synthetase
MSVRTRFAPSPTGYLHIGGVRTAIFNWLFARRHSGQFILRIDDTDQTRHVEEALAPILHGFRWLGMQWDEGPEVGGPHGPYFQSQRGEKYRAATARLVESGAAYPCFCTTAEIEAERDAAKQAKLPYQYSKKCRGRSAAERERLRTEGRTSVIRFAVPPDRSVAFTDLILGPVGKETRDIGDFVIARGDGSPLYNFASVVDDIDMQITHVIRAQEHLTNTYSQWLVFEALGVPVPAFAHVPYVAAPGSKEKISKRKLEPFRALMTPEIKEKFRAMGWRDEDAPNPVMMSYYEELGYLPDAMLNGLSRIGWSLDDKQEKISRAELLEHFTLDRVNSAPASFDPDKLWWLQGEYMKELPVEQKIDGCIRPLQKAKLLGGTTAAEVDSATRDKLQRIIDAAADRLKVFSDILTYGGFFFAADDQFEYEPDAVKNLKKDYVPALLPKLRDLIAAAEPFDVPTLEARVRELADAADLGAGKVIHPLRAATSGQSVGPGVFELVAILGRASCLRRIERTIELLAHGEL